MLDIPHQTWRNAVIHVMNATIAHSLATLARKSQALNGIGSTITSMETTGALMAHAPLRGKKLTWCRRI
jgi:hypothetical protein